MFQPLLRHFEEQFTQILIKQSFVVGVYR